MVTLLRKIRHQLLQENRFSRYLLYAIGEIFLVVIGILIALQINNWNEEKKARKYELKMLQELQSVLNRDREYFNSQINRLTEKEKSANRLIQAIEAKEENLDTLNKYLQGLRYEILFQYNSGPYESIQSGGLDKISNDSIRSKMTGLYEFLIPRSEKVLDQLKSSELLESQLLEQITRRNIMDLPSGGRVIRGKIMDSKVIYGDEFLHLVQINKNSTFVAKSQMERLVPHIDSLLNLLKVEVGN
ncbi:DUF6090 family protein [Algoriphagus sp. AK58]|uniref:DUF6090 family protein n=1 Tax=Algoriphagus sp. AK58 TaxID=1406877 RepID=UPI00164EF0AF|nr:DUF6090 family protein [Algoriphagus sp. AK58]MBC6365645.1 hypothetical protein [Algoriphagus sp. AK58]